MQANRALAVQFDASLVDPRIKSVGRLSKASAMLECTSTNPGCALQRAVDGCSTTSPDLACSPL